MKPTEEQRFWAKVDKNGPVPTHSSEIGRCWIWTGASRCGRGLVQTLGRKYIASRVSYEYLVGPISDGLLVLHKCDVGLCVNPNHLYLGSHVDNARDRDSRNRQSRGENRPAHKLSEQDVVTIRHLHSSKELTARSISIRYNVSQTLVYQIVHRKAWRWVA